MFDKISPACSQKQLSEPNRRRVKTSPQSSGDRSEMDCLGMMSLFAPLPIGVLRVQYSNPG